MVRAFDYEVIAARLLEPDIAGALSQINRLRGRLDLQFETDPAPLLALSEIAKIQSVDGSNRIEGISTTNARLVALMQERATPRNRSEAEIAGYRDVLNMVHEQYEHIPLSPSVILQFHRDMNRYSSTGLGGIWKPTDNLIAERSESGEQMVRFIPVSALETPAAVESICSNYNEAVKRELADPLLLTCIFVFDLTCIHPFMDGNGRMSRLLTLLLLYRSGYTAGRYVSIERLIQRTRETYYEALLASSQGWHEVANDYRPFVRYMLGVVLAAYRDLSARADAMRAAGSTKADRVEEMLTQYQVPVRKRDILDRYPDISETTVERTLAQMLKRGTITKIGAGPATAYVARPHSDLE